jgi:hypothetical protein
MAKTPPVEGSGTPGAGFEVNLAVHHPLRIARKPTAIRQVSGSPDRRRSSGGLGQGPLTHKAARDGHYNNAGILSLTR